MNPSQDNNNMDSQSTENIQPGASSPPSTPNEKVSQIDKEREMAELLMTMDNYKAIIPDAVIDYYLNKTGFDCDDARIKKLFALAAQKFIADIATDAFQYNKVKQSSTRTTTKANKEKKIILNMDDLSSALAEYGVNVKKPDFY
ncbi:transcription initiation factor TFIID 23-30kDa subunit-domain-containing protein [Pilaira anomala]|nr:transcription initiation factor TFIID 23-30kDa subunit-domain-containing protein [Pilaira anomala]